MNATATRTQPARYSVSSFPEIGVTYTSRTGNITVIGEAILVGSGLYNAKVREDDGNTFCAYLDF